MKQLFGWAFDLWDKLTDKGLNYHYFEGNLAKIDIPFSEDGFSEEFKDNAFVMIINALTKQGISLSNVQITKLGRISNYLKKDRHQIIFTEDGRLQPTSRFAFTVSQDREITFALFLNLDSYQILPSINSTFITNQGIIDITNTFWEMGAILEDIEP